MVQSDAELLAQIATPQRERAFELIVQRHGPFVYRVCLHLLRHPVDAEDAAQAVFLVLLRRAESIGKIDSLPAWLHEVARRVAHEARRSTLRREHRQENAAVMLTKVAEDKTPAADNAELWSAVHRELNALSTSQRQAIILRYLEGHSREDAARIAGCSPEALTNRASVGIAKLRERLTRGGFELPAGALVLMMEKDAGLSVPAVFTTGSLSAKAASTVASSLASATLKAMLKAKVAVMSLYAACAVILLIGSLGAYQITAGEVKVPAPAGPGPAPAQEAFVPKGGKIVLDVAMPARAPQLCHIKWSLDGKKILSVVDRAWYDNKGSRGRQGNYDVEIHVMDVDRKTDEKLLSNVQNLPEWLIGNRLLIEAEGKLWVYENAGKGARHELPGKEWFQCCVSRDGKFVAYMSGEKGGNVIGLPVKLYDVASAKLSELPFPLANAPEGASRLMRLGFWTDDGLLCLSAALAKADAKGTEDWTRFLFDPIKGSFTQNDQFGSNMFPNRYTRVDGRILLSDMTWLAPVSETKRPEPKAAPAAGDVAKAPAPMGGPDLKPGVPTRPIEVLKCGPTTAFKRLDINGKVIKEIN